jgi:hypothetical protein
VWCTVVVIGGAVLAACGGDDSSSSSSSSSTSSTSTTAASTTTTTAGAASTTAAPAGPGTCQTSSLAAAISPPDAGAGQRHSVLVFTNNSGATCTMQGYVGLQLLYQDGGTVPTNVVRQSGPNTLVTLAPGAQAYTTLQWGVIPSGNEPQNGPCEPTAAQIQITSPNATTFLLQPWPNGPVCQQGTFNTVPVAAGGGPPQP